VTALIRGWKPGLIGTITAEHGRFYAREWDFGSVFEGKVAEALGEWTARAAASSDLLLSAFDGELFLGSIAVDGLGGPPQSARLRFFIMTDAARGRGIGRRLIAEALGFVDEAGFERCVLTTFAGLDAARHLYESLGFRLVKEETAATWGRPVSEQLFERVRSAP
jgi:GNAT superfamily N-acetyltransferase